MGGAMREINQSDIDLERIFNLFDAALTSKDERVVGALRSLLMIVTLTAPEIGNTEKSLEGREGPLRRLMSDHNDLIRRINRIDNELETLSHLQRSMFRTETTAIDGELAQYIPPNMRGPSK